MLGVPCARSAGRAPIQALSGLWLEEEVTVTLMRRLPLILAAALSAACNHNPRIACTRGTLRACFGIDISFNPVGDSTIITIRIQDLQGIVRADNTAWSQLLYLRVYRNMAPSLSFPGPGTITPSWDATVTPIGPGAPGSGWTNMGVNYPSFVSEWVAAGASPGSSAGYVTGRDVAYSEFRHTGAGLRTFTAPEKAPGWVTFYFVAHHIVTAADVGVQISAFASDQPASAVVAPQQVGCQVIPGGGSVTTDCDLLTYGIQ